MGTIYLSINGNGSAYSIPPSGETMVDGEAFTIYLIPDGSAEILSVRAYDSHDYSVALPAISEDNTISMNFRSGWGSLYVEIYFSGSTPPTPPTPPTGVFAWLYKKIADKNNVIKLFDL